jgi:ABC-type cobalamin/Fe3+-siderophores transport system ATPase subunit
MLEIENLNFHYGNKQILKDINVTIKTGEILGLIGPNGSGKSTLLRCFNGFLKPSSGQITLNGKNIHKQTRKWISRHIAFLPQNLEMIQHISIYELVAMGRSPYQRYGWSLNKDDREKIEWAIDYMNLRHLQDNALDKLSGGERQRAWIAMILAQDTEVILLDEPITYLDLKYQWNLLDVVKQIRQKYNKTFVLVLHDLNQAMMAADSFVVLKNGCIRACGETRDIITPHLLKDVYDVSAQVCNLGNSMQKFVIPANIE